MKISRAEAKKLGLDVPPTKKQHKWDTTGKPKSVQYAGDGTFDKLCEAHGIPKPESEYHFAPWEGGDPKCSPHAGVLRCRKCGASKRGWRFDHLFDGWLALEIEGGAFTEGRHTRGQGFKDDIEKYNAAAIAGYVVIRCTPEDVTSGAAFALVRRALDHYLEMP